MNGPIMQIKGRQNQRGAVLVISLILLLLMTILAVSMSQTTTLNERMAGNARDAAAALQGADAGIKDAEALVRNATEPELMSYGAESCGAGTKSKTICPGGPSTMDSAALNQAYLSNLPDSWWNNNDNAFKFGVDGTKELDGNDSDPTYFNQTIAHVTDSSLTNEGGAHYVFVEITARSHGKTAQSQAVVQTVYAKAVSK